MSNKVNFTAQHMSRLKALALVFLMAGTMFKGAISTTLNVFALMHDTTVNSLRTLYGNLEKEINSLKTKSKWEMNDYQQRKLSEYEEQLEFLDLLIGYKLYQEQVKENKKLITQKKAELAELQNSLLKPEDRINLLQQEIEALDMEKEEVVAVVIPPAPEDTAMTVQS